MFRSRTFAAALLGALVACQSYAIAADNDERPDKVTAVRAFRASTLTGMTVYNTGGQEVGTINDLVINVEKGTIEYAALSVGGFLGIGDKLFAVPYRLLKLKFDEDKNYFVLDINKEVLERAPGFNQDAWPDVADPNWANEIEKYYGATAASSHEGTFERMDNGNQLVMKDATGENMHTHLISKELVVMRGDQRSNTAALRAGDRIRVTLGNYEGTPVVTKIEILNRS